MLPPDYITLIAVIVGTITTDSWVDTGGPGKIQAFPNAQALVITQTRKVHEQVALLLAKLRQVQDLDDEHPTVPGRRRSIFTTPTSAPTKLPASDRIYVPAAATSLVRTHQ